MLDKNKVIKKPNLLSLINMIDNVLMISKIDAEGNFTYANDFLCSNFGYSQNELIGQGFDILKPTNSIDFKEIKKILSIESSWRGEVCRHKKSGEIYWEDMTVIPEYSDSGSITFFITLSFDITAQVLKRERLQQESDHDSLTSLLNRQGFYRHAKARIKDAHRNYGGVYLALLDLDKFKEINDNHGHAVGDEVLQMLGRRMLSCVNEHIFIGRLGGDEFSILFIENNENRSLTDFFNSLLSQIRKPFFISSINQPITLSASIGIVDYPSKGYHFSLVMRMADNLLYEVKSRGGDDFIINGN